VGVGRQLSRRWFSSRDEMGVLIFISPSRIQQQKLGEGGSAGKKQVTIYCRIATQVTMSELGALPPGWDTKFDPRTGR
jgi:hypothetical protein